MTHWISALLGLLTAVIILYLVRRDHLHTRYALWWLPMAFAIGVLGVFPSITDYLGALLGVGYPPVIVVVTGFLLITLKILFMDIERSRNEVKLARLAQRMALLEERMRQLDGQQMADESLDQLASPAAAGGEEQSSTQSVQRDSAA